MLPKKQSKNIPHSPLKFYSEPSALMNPKLSFKKISTEHLSALPFLSLIGHTNKHLLETQQEFSTLSTKHITTTCVSARRKFWSQMRWRNVDREAVLNVRNGLRGKREGPFEETYGL